MNNYYKINDLQTCIKLDLNEYDFNHHSNIRGFLTNCIINENNITHYSNKNNNLNTLLDLLKQKNNIQNILLTAGSDNALEYIINTFLNDNYIIIFVPSYIYFEVLVQNRTNKIIYIPVYNNDCDLNICFQLYSEIMENAIVYIVNPNNPLGTYFSIKNIEKVIRKWYKTLFVLDEAYIEFCYEKTCIHLTNIYDNLVVTRTFSKAYGLAGLRLGYIASSKNIINRISKIYNEKNVTEIAKTAGIFILNNIDYYDNNIKQIIEIRDDFELFLKSMNIFFYKSYGNFISFYVGKNYKKFLTILENKNIYIRNRNNQINMNGFLRISIGIKEHMMSVKNVITENIKLFDTNCIHQFITSTDHMWKLKLLFSKLINILNSNNIQYWLDSGTLLGYYRYKGILPWDDDIDIGILNDDVSKIENLKDILQKNNMRLKKNRTNVYYQVDFIDEILDKNITNTVHIDIFFFQKHENKYINTDERFILNDDEKCNFIYEHHDLFPLKKSTFYNIDIYVPNNVENILSKNIKGDYINYAVFTKNSIKYTFDLNHNNMIAA